MKTFAKIIPAIIFVGIFIYVVFNIPYPLSITQASLFQLLVFFLPLLFAVIFIINIFLSLIFSVVISLGLILLLILKALDSLNFLSAIAVILVVGLFISYFRKTKTEGLSFKKTIFGSGIPKLKLSNKFKQVKLSTSRRRKRR